MSYILHVKVIEATDIQRMDTFGKSDPFIVLQLAGLPSKRTSVKHNTLKPVWNETFSFPVTNMNATLYFLLKDEDVACDDEMARLEIALNALRFGQVVDNWYNMRPIRGVRKGGQLHLVLHLADASSPPFVQGPPMGAYPQQPNPMMYAVPQPGMYPQVQPGMYPPPGPGYQPAVPYPGQPAPYPGQQAPYPGQPAPYPGQPAPYPGQPAPYPGQPAPYPGQPAPYPGQPGVYPQVQPGMYPPPGPGYRQY